MANAVSGLSNICSLASSDPETGRVAPHRSQAMMLLDRIESVQTCQQWSLPSLRKNSASCTACGTTANVPISRPTDHEFIALMGQYRSFGGIATREEVAARMRRAGAGDLSTLARRIAARELISFEWNGGFWLPLFQFDLSDMSLKESTRRIVAELNTVLDGWEFAKWLADPDEALRGKRPVEVIDSGSPEVLHAARLARYIARG